MTRTTTIRTFPTRGRRCFRAVSVASLAFWFLAGSAWAAGERGGFQQAARPAPVVREAPPRPPKAPPNGFAPRSQQNPQNQEHLQQWMQSHGGLTIDQQQRALESEPGFRQLAPDTQQRMHQRLAQLNGMTPEQRQRAFARTEAMERLAPEQRQQVRGALTSLGNLPKDRRFYVAREFRALRGMPPVQRQAFLNSPTIRSQFSDQERVVLNGLFDAEPYLPPPAQFAPAPMAPR